MTNQPSVIVEELRHSYGAVEALKGISFEIRQGEILGFLGPNGAGKSTTIKILTGQLAPNGGRGSVLGFDVSADDPRLQAQIGVCFEEKNLYEAMTGAENLAFFGRLFGIRRLDSAALLSRVGLADRADDRVKTYSKGMRQRLMMARALVNAPQVLFLDEPTAGLDPVSSDSVRRLIREEADRGAAVLLTTHDMAEADELSDRVAFLNDGELYAVDTPENLKLEHGRRAVRVRVRRGAEVTEESIPLDDPDASRRLADLVSAGQVVTIHTEEASLSSIFIEMTGRELEG
ncbi:MAG: ABC transporter ATP-binding protein [Acidimicrobiia bacterium]|nr:ABC transporter ATP-binding protein [Acidimicrobiia bacterium]MDH5292628.1 ABC transporter ATP-binding protein [Acidimicrobiia bacterium]